jgi:hypothetical protein
LLQLNHSAAPQQRQWLPFNVQPQADIQELQLLGADSQPLLDFATPHGSTIQSFGHCEYDTGGVGVSLQLCE